MYFTLVFKSEGKWRARPHAGGRPISFPHGVAQLRLTHLRKTFDATRRAALRLEQRLNQGPNENRPWRGEQVTVACVVASISRDGLPIYARSVTTSDKLPAVRPGESLFVVAIGNRVRLQRYMNGLGDYALAALCGDAYEYLC